MSTPPDDAMQKIGARLARIKSNPRLTTPVHDPSTTTINSNSTPPSTPAEQTANGPSDSAGPRPKVSNVSSRFSFWCIITVIACATAIGVLLVFATPRLGYEERVVGWFNRSRTAPSRTKSLAAHTATTFAEYVYQLQKDLVDARYNLEAQESIVLDPLFQTWAPEWPDFDADGLAQLQLSIATALEGLSSLEDWAGEEEFIDFTISEWMGHVRAKIDHVYNSSMQTLDKEAFYALPLVKYMIRAPDLSTPTCKFLGTVLKETKNTADQFLYWSEIVHSLEDWTIRGEDRGKAFFQDKRLCPVPKDGGCFSLENFGSMDETHYADVGLGDTNLALLAKEFQTQGQLLKAKQARISISVDRLLERVFFMSGYVALRMQGQICSGSQGPLQNFHEEADIRARQLVGRAESGLSSLKEVLLSARYAEDSYVVLAETMQVWDLLFAI